MSLPPENQAAEAAACERCGAGEPLEIGGRTLCKDCAELAGCGCAGHPDDDGE